ncbi:Glucose-methanol-choline oxidoreductase, N-terminal [Penicillium italicum]|uniref:Glucose-methanol-choline oxidoreductase, N-terminal n=1 Tax=Penicillium italicum TaxID=40296 RepID=A0A0A2L3S7_PENIT|nr:Glucose-methanol-choline oxidoreductase, N-terminal [Penicillium italicum]
MGNDTLQQFAALDLDYLIIGGGTAGLAVAARLTDDPEFKVGVIEAGPSVLNLDDNGAINVPGRYGETIGSKYDWKFKTIPQPGLGGRSLPWPRGRILGGTSALNLMAWNRGHRKDYDAWAELGNEGWGWEDLFQAKEVAQNTGRTRDALLASQFESGEARGQVEYLFDLGNWSPYYVSEPGKKYATMLQMLQYPFSRGSIHIPPMSETNYEKATIDDKPVIDPRYFLGPGEIDKKVMAKALRWGDRICQTEPLAKLIHTRVFPPPANGADSEEKLYEDFVSNYTVTDWHPVGTCAMGKADGANAGVVNDMLQVHGVHALRVVDASIMPLQVGAHIQATVYAIAEKAAVMIMEDYFARNYPL